MARDRSIYINGEFIGSVYFDNIYYKDGRYAGKIDYSGWVWDREEKLFGKDPEKDPVKLLLRYATMREYYGVEREEGLPDREKSQRLNLERTSRMQGGRRDLDSSEAREISVAVYLDTEDQAQISRVLQAVDVLLDALGYGDARDVIIEAGSVFRRWWARIRRGMSSTEVQERLIKIERAFELAKLDQAQAAVDVAESKAVSLLIDALKENSRACIRLGSIMLVKYESKLGETIFTRNLSQLEIRALERYPEIQKYPESFLDTLATAVEALQEPPFDYPEAQ